MAEENYEIESQVPFSESFVWTLNRDYYESSGIGAWRSKEVPSQLTSSSMVGKTYANLIIGFLKDLKGKGQLGTVYILELGAGHGRLAFHILRHLDQMLEEHSLELPPYCYILSDIVEENLSFYKNHAQFSTYFEQKKLDVAYFDALQSEELELHFAKKTIKANSLDQTIIAIGNYFFDSIPTDLFFLKNRKIHECLITLRTASNPEDLGSKEVLKLMEPTYTKQLLSEQFYENEVSEMLLQEYNNSLLHTFLFFPHLGMICIERIKQLSKKGLLLLSLDKGFHALHDLENQSTPELIIHGSFSIWVNYHALGRYCELKGGKAIFPSFANFHLELACLLFVKNSETYSNTIAAYQKNVDDYGPDDFNSLKKHTYNNMMKMSLSELLAMQRLSAYDSTFFINTLPRFKQIAARVTFNERHRIAQTMVRTWEMYFTIKEEFDLAYEMGGIFYDLGFYQKALEFFGYSIEIFGEKADILYNKALCFYQLRQDEAFLWTLQHGKSQFPNYQQFEHLDRLDLKS